MGNIKINGSDRSPEINFGFGANVFLLKGESYTEDITAFYDPVISKLEEHLAGLTGATVQFTCELIYFNSSTAKVLMGLFETFEETASDGNDVTVIWIHETDDDNMKEIGEEFGEDLEHANFELKAVEV